MTLLPDRPTLNDSFGHASHVEDCVHYLQALNGKNTPFVIHLDGHPGVGKSTFVALLTRQVREQGSYAHVVLDAPAFESQERLLSSLLHAATRSLSSQVSKEIAQTLQGVLKKVAEVDVKTDSRGATGDRERPGQSFRVGQQVREFIKAAQADGRKLLIVLDHLDYCSPTLIRELLAVVRLHFSVPGVVVLIVGEDALLTARFRSEEFPPYARDRFSHLRVVQMRIHLPVLAPQQVVHYLQQHLEPPFQEPIEALFPMFVPTPRFVLGFLNQLHEIRQHTANHPEVEPKLLELLVLVSMRFPSLYNDLEIYGKKMLAALSGAMKAISNVTNLDGFLQKMPPFIRERVKGHCQNEELVFLLEEHLNFMLKRDLNPYFFPKVHFGTQAPTPARVDDSASYQGPIGSIESAIDEEDILPDDIPDPDALDGDAIDQNLGDSGEYDEDLEDDEIPSFEDDEDEDDLDMPKMGKLPPEKLTGVPDLGNPGAGRRKPTLGAEKSRKISEQREMSRQAAMSRKRALSQKGPASRAVDPAAKERSVSIDSDAKIPPPSNKLNRETVLAKVKNKESLEGANLTDIDLRDTDLKGVNFSGANLTRANLERANLRKANLQGAIIQETVFSGANLMDANLIDVAGQGADFFGTNLWGSKVDDSELPQAQFRGANMRAVSLKNTNVEGANFMGAELVDAILIGANFKGAIFDQQTTLHFAVIEGWTIDTQIRDVIEKKYTMNDKNILVPKTKAR